VQEVDRSKLGTSSAEAASVEGQSAVHGAASSLADGMEQGPFYWTQVGLQMAADGCLTELLGSPAAGNLVTAEQLAMAKEHGLMVPVLLELGAMTKEVQQEGPEEESKIPVDEEEDSEDEVREFADVMMSSCRRLLALLLICGRVDNKPKRRKHMMTAGSKDGSHQANGTDLFGTDIAPQ